MPKIVDKQRKREGISSAAIGVFRQLGYHQARMADIARAAGVGKGTLYEYFGDKSDILRFAFDSYFDAFKMGAQEAISVEGGPADKLLALIDFALAHVDEWEDHCAAYVDYLGLGRSSQEAVSLSGIYGEMRDVLVPLIRHGQTTGEICRDLDPLATAELLLSMYDGIVLHRIFEERQCDIASLRAAALAILAQGLRPDGAG